VVRYSPLRGAPVFYSPATRSVLFDRPAFISEERARRLPGPPPRPPVLELKADFPPKCLLSISQAGISWTNLPKTSHGSRRRSS
jgi:hypothetical protein